MSICVFIGNKTILFSASGQAVKFAYARLSLQSGDAFHGQFAEFPSYLAAPPGRSPKYKRILIPEARTASVPHKTIDATLYSF